jgi:hypothetical protein
MIKQIVTIDSLLDESMAVQIKYNCSSNEALVTLLKDLLD